MWVNGVVNNDKVELALKNHGWYPRKNKPPPKGTIEAVVHKLLCTKWTSWETFATTRYDDKLGKPNGAEFLSLEYIHNNIHVSFSLERRTGHILGFILMETSHCRIGLVAKR